MSAVFESYWEIHPISNICTCENNDAFIAKIEIQVRPKPQQPFPSTFSSRQGVCLRGQDITVYDYIQCSNNYLQPLS